MSTTLPYRLVLIAACVAGTMAACGGGESSLPPTSTQPPQPEATADPCAAELYVEPAQSPYVLPWQPGLATRTGLSNCSSSYHAAGLPDQYAYDFDLPEGTPFVAARSGRIRTIVNDQPSAGGGVGNYVVVDHGDGSSGVYLHAPRGGIRVRIGATVSQGEVLGVTGRSGMAGYPHLHFIVVQGEVVYPYTGLPVSFRNADPAHRPLRSRTTYTAQPY